MIELFETAYYIPLNPQEKRPMYAWGGWPIARDHEHVYTYEETQEKDWRNWAIVDDETRTLLIIDIDLYAMDEDQRQAIDDGWGTLLDTTTIVRSQNGGLHVYVLVDGDVNEVPKAIENVDLKGPVAKGYAAAPFSPGYELVNDAEPAVVSPEYLTELPVFENGVTPSSPAEDYEPTLTRREIEDLEVTSNVQDVFDAIAHTTYGDFELKSPQTDGGSSHDSRKSFDPCWVESSSGTRLGHEGGTNFIYRADSIPLNALQIVALEEGIIEHEGAYPEGADFWNAVDALRDRGAPIPTYEPKYGIPEVEKPVRDMEYTERVVHEGKNRTNRILGTELDGNIQVNAPLGIGKTMAAVKGARERSRLIITGNKGEHRESARYFASEAGLTVAEVVPFTNSWLASGASPVQNEVLSLIARGWNARDILPLYREFIPDDIDDPYLAQFEKPIDADILLGSPGHETVKHFRETSEEKREIIYDDTHPALYQIEDNIFGLVDDEWTTSDRAEINALLRNLDRVESNCVEDLTPVDQDVIRRMYPGSENDEDDAETIEELLDLRTTGPGIEVPLMGIALREGEIRADTLLKLKIICGTEFDDIVSFQTDDSYSYVRLPPIGDHKFAILSGTPAPHVTEAFCERLGTPIEYVEAVNNQRSFWQARNLQVVQTSRNQNARSGGNINPERTEHIHAAIEDIEGQGVPSIDAKKALEMTGLNGTNFARAPSNNDYRDDQVGFVSGCTYFGDEYVELLAAFCDEDVTIKHDGRAHCDNPVGADLLQWMKQAPVAQAIGRFGRNDDPTRVYVDTDQIPNYFPVIDITDEIVEITETERDAYTAVLDGAITANEIYERVDVGSRQVRNIARALEQKGLVELDEYATANGEHVVESADDPFGNIDMRVTIRRLPNDTRLPDLDTDSVSDRPVDSTQQIELGEVEVDNPPPG